MASDDLAASLSDFLAGALDREAAEVHDLRRLSGGASRETWSFDLFDALDGSTTSLILQRVRAGTVGGAFTMEGEAGLLRAAASAGVPVAPVVAASDDPAVVGSPFLVMGHVAGETIARRILRDDEFAAARPRLVGQSAAALAGIHQLPVTVAPHLRADDPVRQLRGLLDALGQPHPAFELGLRWLDQHRPPAAEPAVVHGDFRLGNLMIDADGLAAVLDWELAHLGDPVEDLGWLCVRAWRFGSDLPVAGVGGYGELIDAYQEAAGRMVVPDHLRWWEALGTLRWGLICVLQASGHLSGASRSVELAAIGRRVCENEYDLLALIDGRPTPTPTPTPMSARADDSAHNRPQGGTDGTQTAPALHDAPSAAQLIEAVREYLERDVMAATQGRVQFHARVAARVLATVERELALGPGQVAAHTAGLESLGFASDVELAAAIRRSDVALPEAWVAFIWDSVQAKVEVANPGYLLPVDR